MSGRNRFSSNSRRTLHSVHLGRLKIGVTEEELYSLFQDAGEVAAVFIQDEHKMTSSNGLTYGFVRYKTADECDAAIQRFNGWPLQGSELSVNYAHEPGHRPESQNNRGRNYKVEGQNKKPPSLDLPCYNHLLKTLKDNQLEEDIPFLLDELEMVEYSRVPLYTETPPPESDLDLTALHKLIITCNKENTPVNSEDPIEKEKSPVGRLYTKRLSSPAQQLDLHWQDACDSSHGKGNNYPSQQLDLQWQDARDSSHGKGKNCPSQQLDLQWQDACDSSHGKGKNYPSQQLDLQWQDARDSSHGNDVKMPDTEGEEKESPALSRHARHSTGDKELTVSGWLSDSSMDTSSSSSDVATATPAGKLPSLGRGSLLQKSEINSDVRPFVAFGRGKSLLERLK